MSNSNPLQVAQELVTIFASEDDNEVLSKVANNYQERANLRRGQENEVKEAIQGLTRTVETHRKKMQMWNEDVENSRKLDTLGTEKDVTLQHIEKLETDLKRLTEIVGENEKAAMEIEQKKIEAQRQSKDIQAKIKYNFSLYTNISRIRWDYNCEEDQVKGFVASLNDVKPFCLDSKQNSKFFMANYLWDLVE